MRRVYTQITLYVAREFLLSFSVAFLFFFFVFFVNQMLLMAEQVLTKRVGAWQVFCSSSIRSRPLLRFRFRLLPWSEP